MAKDPDLFDSSSAASKGYTAKDIEVLEGLEPVRRRPGMYIGGTDERALHHLAAEILDNAMDEAVAGHATRIEMELVSPTPRRGKRIVEVVVGSVRIVNHVWLVQRLSVDVHLLVHELQPVARQADDAFHEMLVIRVRIFEHDNVSALQRAEDDTGAPFRTTRRCRRK